ncbi:MAG: hypothetical protein KDE65_03390, partial [Burkholderiaceae bacterium]|nr:hypothetical protein [Burkholderiaceae bacterium]
MRLFGIGNALCRIVRFRALQPVLFRNMEMVFAVCRKARRPKGILCKPEITDLPRHRMNAHRARKPLSHGFAAVAWALAAACGASAAAAQTVLERV